LGRLGPQLIVGNGGDNPDIAVAGPTIRSETIDKMTANIFQIQRYGYIMMDRSKDGWIGTAFSVDDEIMGRAYLSEGRQVAWCHQLCLRNLEQALPSSCLFW
jgi:hypothetical protein